MRSGFHDQGVGVPVVGVRRVGQLLDALPCQVLPELGEQLAEFRQYLAGQGIKELAYATYPDDGYTYALVVEAAPHQQKALVKELERILFASLRRSMAREPEEG